MHPYLAAWRRASERLSAPLHTADGGLNASAELHIDRGGVELVARGHFAAGFSTTRVDTALPGSAGLRLRVRERRVRAPLRRGMSVVQIGEGAFAEELRVDANEAGLAELWLSPTVRTAVLDADPYDRYEFNIADGALSAMAPGRFEDDASVLCGVVEAAVAFVDRAAEIDREWRALAAAVGGRALTRWSATGEPLVSVARGGADVFVDAYLGPLGGKKGALASFTRVKCVRSSERTPDPYAVHRRCDDPVIDVGARVRPMPIESLGPDYVVRASVFAPQTTRFGAARCRLLEDVAPMLVLATAEEVSVWLGGVDVVAEQVAGAIELCRGLAVERETAADGPYR